MLPFDLPPASTDRPLPRLFILADSISFYYGPYLERMLAGRFACDRKGTELLSPPVGADRRWSTSGRVGPPPASSGSDAHLADEVSAGAPLPDVGLLERALALDIESYEVNAGDSACVLAYLRDRRPACDLLLLNCGLHDLRVDPKTGTHQVAPEDYARYLDEILRLANEIAAQVVWVRSTPVSDALHNRLNPEFQRFNADVIAYNAISDRIVRRRGVPSIDLYHFTLSLCARLEDLDGLILDHVHFTEPVRQLQAAYIAGWLEQQNLSGFGESRG